GLVFLTLGGYVQPSEAFTGFASPAVITMLSIFFVSGALLHTGVADMIGGRVRRVIGDREILLVLAIMAVGGVLSAFMNNVAAVAVLLPAVASIARKTGIAPSRLFMPLSFGAILGGTMTLVGTPPNILAGDLLRERGLEPFSLFDYTPIGAILLATGMLYMITVGRWLLPKRNIAGRTKGGEDLSQVYHLQEAMFGIRVKKGSSLVGKTLADSRLGATLDAQVAGIVRDGHRRLAPGADTVLEAEDLLLVEGRHERVKEMFGVHGIEIAAVDEGVLSEAWSDVRCAAIRVDEGSGLVDTSLRALHFREQFGVLVVGIRRDGELVGCDLPGTPLRVGDELLVMGSDAQVDALDLPATCKDCARPGGCMSDLFGHVFLLRIHAGSTLAGMRIRDSQIAAAAGLTVVGIRRGESTLLAVGPDQKLRVGDELMVTGDPERVRTLLDLGDAQLQQDLTQTGIESDDVGIVEVTLAPRSRVEGKTLAEISFRENYGLQVLAIWRKGKPVHRALARRRLRFGDALLVQGSRRKIRLLGADPDYSVLSPSAQQVRRTKRAPVAVGALVVMILMVVTGFQPIHVAAFTAATLVVLFGAIRMEEAYRAVEWKAVFLVAAILPMGIALERTGAALLASDAVSAATGPYGPYAAMAGLFTLSSVLSQCLDGAPAVVMMTPVVIESAAQLAISPYALMMGVSLAASAAFMTPFSHKANLLVMGSGGYRTIDYLRVGTPLTIILLVLMVLLVPVFFSIQG
ncbi:MAG: SLC13 family permease, partial [Myxococcota bacterium]|nr:SLC13 family permease [Myxococcota bacterium]